MKKEQACSLSQSPPPFEIRLNMFSGENSGKDYFPVVLDADRKYIEKSIAPEFAERFAGFCL